MSRFLFVSEGWIEAVAPGRTAGELTGKTDFDVFTEEHAAAAFADEQEIIRTGQPIVGQVERETFSGRPDTWVSTTKMPLRDDHGEIIGTFGISRDITAQIRAESALAWQAGELGAQNERLRELDRLKDEFVALVSHELRTPLTSIIGYIQLLRDERASGLDTDHFAEVIERNAERLLRLVGDLLFLSKMQSGQLALELRETDLASLAGQAVEEARPEAERKHIGLVLSAAPVPGSVDPTRIAQLLGNLITNAVKFTPEGGKVEVRLGAEDGEAVLSVADTGIGIPAADRERVFERFYRTEAATRRVIPGSGLGLTISRAIVDAHGGTITVRSDGKHGSTFTVRLPLALGGSACWCAHRWCGLASGQPPAARWDLTRATSEPRTCWLVTSPMALRIAAADSGSLSLASASAISLTSTSVSVAAGCPPVNGLRVAQASRADTMLPGSVPAWAASAPSADQRPERPAQSVYPPPVAPAKLAIATQTPRLAAIRLARSSWRVRSPAAMTVPAT